MIITLSFSVTSNSHEVFVRSHIKPETNTTEINEISISEISHAISKLPVDKSAGYDDLSSEHFKYASARLHVMLALSMSAMLVHGYLPENLMRTFIVPLVKNKTGDFTSKDNYRPIAVATVSSKILKIVILERCKDYLCTEDIQFG